jgi:hypothetical protein
MNKSQYLYLSVAAAVALSLAACAPPAQPDSQSPKESGTASQSSDSPTGSSTATPPDSAPETTSPGGSSATPAPTDTATDLPAVELKTFTFPDGHISFSYPADWNVRVAQAPYLPGSDAGNSLEAVLSDGTGNEVASITSGTYGDGAAGPVLRTVLDQAPVPGLMDINGDQASFGFAFDSFADHPQFHMGIRRNEEFTSGTTSSGSPQIVFPNGAAVARVIFGDPAFPSVDEAKAWMNTKQYQQLKALLLSVKYA